MKKGKKLLTHEEVIVRIPSAAEVSSDMRRAAAANTLLETRRYLEHALADIEDLKMAIKRLLEESE